MNSNGLRVLCGIVVAVIGVLVLLAVVTDFKMALGLGLIIAGVGIAV